MESALQGADASAAEKAPARHRSSRRLPWLVAYAFFLVLLLEGASRAYWAVETDVPFFGTSGLLTTLYYPEIQPIVDAEIGPGDGAFDVLLLGGSVLHDDFGGVGPRLQDLLQKRTGRRVRVHNAAFSAHTTRDSFYKYQALADKRFDLVILYHGINEVRANNVPPELFRDDYGHYGWYRALNQLDHRREVGWFALPYSLTRLWTGLREKLGMDDYVPLHLPREGWLEFGSDIRTAAPFADNVRAILELTRERGEPLLLMTFAFHPGIEGGYGIGLWGRKPNVLAGLRAHNRALLEVARAERGDDVLLIHQAKLIPRDDTLFTDTCHLSPAGVRKFVSPIVRKVAPLVAASGEAAKLLEATVPAQADAPPPAPGQNATAPESLPAS